MVYCKEDFKGTKPSIFCFSTLWSRIGASIAAICLLTASSNLHAAPDFPHTVPLDQRGMRSILVTFHEAEADLESMEAGRKAPPFAKNNRKQKSLHNAARVAIVSKHQDKLLARLEKKKYRLQRKYSHLPILSLRVDEATYSSLKTTPNISVSDDRLMRPLLAESVPLVLDDPFYDPDPLVPYDRGGGWAVAVLDTGIEKGHAFLSEGGNGIVSRVVSEACYSNLGGTFGFVSLCPGGVTSSTSVGSGVPCTGFPVCNHGTAVAGVAVGDGSTYDGVANAADLVSIQIYSELTLPGQEGIVTTTSELVAGMNRALTLHAIDNNINIASVLIASGDLSIYSTQCDSILSAERAAIDSLKAQGIATVAATGNGSSDIGINGPACVSTAIAVGASTDLDVRWPTSNKGTMLDLYAPGVDITTSSTSGGETTESGTSFAAAHVAGAWAFLKKESPHATVGQIETILQDTGETVSGDDSGKQRINLKEAALVEIPDISGATLTIIKRVSNNNGGIGVVDDFQLKVNAATSSPFAYAAATSTALVFDDETPNEVDGYTTIYTANTLTLASGTSYVLSEDDLPGYVEGNWSCTNDGGFGSGPHDSGLVELAAGEEVTCTIINDDIEPGLTILKDVTNNSGGAATSTDFILRLSGGTLPDSTYDGTEEFSSGDAPKVESNAIYTLSEEPLPGYKLTGIVCRDDSSGTDVGHPMTLAEGQNVTCAISNDDTNFLQIFKDVTNDNGGAATSTSFTLLVTGGVYNGSVARKSGDILEATTNTPYTLSEKLYPGYTQTGIACKDVETGNSISHPVTLAGNQSAVCTISNDDNPSFLTLMKAVVNDDGGDATPDQFVLRISGGKYNGSVPRQSGEVLVADSNTTYTLSEDAFEGYRLDSIACVDNVTTFSLPHPIILTEGQSVTCSLNNDDIAPVLTVEKRVVNKHGGEATPLDFILRITGGDYDGSLNWYSGDMIPVDANTVYTLSEDQLSGYSQEGIECKDVDTDTVIPHPIQLNEGQVAICTISNIDYVSTFFVVPLPAGGASVFDL